MNYYEKHLGDYLKNAAHLTLLEHGVYSRLMDVYYVHEAPIPAAKAARLIAARSKDELAALDAVLQEFFELHDDGCWHQSRCDESIEAYQAGEPEREAKKANELNRMHRHREERARLFKVITDAGEHLVWNVPIAELRAVAARVSGAPETGVRGRSNVSAPATPATATQTPDTNPQSPDTNPQYPEEKTHGPGADGPAPSVTPTQAGSACLALRRAGITDGSTSHPKLLTLLAQGVTNDELVDAARAAVDAKKPKFAYVLGVVEGRRKDAAAVGTLPPATARGNRQQALEDSNRAVGQAWAATDNPEDIDATR